MPNIRPSPSPSAALDLHRAVAEARAYVAQSIPESTQRAYRADWDSFAGWASEKGAKALPAAPATVAAYVADRAQSVRPGTLRRALAAIAKAHKLAGHPNPCTAEPVPSTMKGIERTVGTSTVGKAPATLEAIERMVSTCAPNTLEGLRNRAMLLVGFAGAFRRAELVSLEVRDLAWSADGVVVTVRRSKTDQTGAGQTKPIPFVSGRLCAATALKAWLTACGLLSGPVFRGLYRNGAAREAGLTPQSVALIIKAACVRVGLDPALYSGHSLRAGHVTEARARGVADSDTMAVTGHRRVETLDVYDRRGNPFAKTSAGAVQGDDD